MTAKEINPRKLGADFKKAREDKNKSLEEISVKTKINVEFLKAMEDNKFDFLHIPYVLAFVKSYAKILGMDVDDVTERLKKQLNFELEQAPQPEKHDKEPEDDVIKMQEPPKLKLETMQADSISNKTNKKKITLILYIALLVIIVYSLKNLLSTEDEVPVMSPQTEIPEEPATTAGDDPVQNIPAPPDSIELRLVVSDTTWFRVIIDEKDTIERIYPPGYIRTWNAADKFEIISGKSTGIKLYFNGVQLTGLGSDSTLIQRLILTKDGEPLIRLKTIEKD